MTRWEAVSEFHYARYQRRELTFQEQRHARVREFFGIDASDSEADEIFVGYLERYEAAWAVFDDVVPTLRHLRKAGLRPAILTNGDESHQRLKVERLGLAHEIDDLISSSTLPAAKPDPRAFLAAAERLGHTPEHLLMVGNSLYDDVRGALAIGLDAVLLDRYDVHTGADVSRIRSLHELKTLIHRRTLLSDTAIVDATAGQVLYPAEHGERRAD